MAGPTATSSNSTCPICAGAAPLYCTKQGYGGEWHVHRCANCGYGFVANRPTFDQLNEIYSKDESHLPWGMPTAEMHAHRRDARSLARRIASLAPTRGRSLDVGCGDGAFSFNLHALGFGRPYLIDLDPRAERAAPIVEGSVFHLLSFENFSDEAPRLVAEAEGSGPVAAGGKFSAIIMSQVLEHALDPLDWLRRAASLLSDDGILAVAVPNFGGVYRILGARDPFIHPPIHLNFFSPKAMALAMKRSGLSPVRLESCNEISMSRRAGVKGAVIRAAVATWNAVSVALNPTARGIILRAFAARAPGGPSEVSTQP